MRLTSHLKRFLRFHPARGENQVLGPADPHHTGKADGSSAAGDHAHLRLGEPDLRRRVDHPQIAG